MAKWRGQDEVLRNMDGYEQKIVQAAEGIANYFAPEMERYAKENAPWKDRTANAKQSLHGWVDVQGKKVTVYISHGVSYGLWLEVKAAGKWSILYPTVQEYIPQVRQMLKDVFGTVR